MSTHFSQTDKLILSTLLVILVGITFWVLSPLLLPKEVSTTTTNTPAWKTYKNDELGFSMQYPPEWKVVSMDPERVNGKLSGIHFIYQPPDSALSYTLSVLRLENPNKFSAKELAIQSMGDTPPRYESAENITIGSYSGYIFHSVFAIDQLIEDLTIAIGDHAYRFSYPSGENNPNVLDSKANAGPVEKMLETFYVL